jgi:hypothetical protein
MYRVTLQHFSRVAADKAAIDCISMKGRPAQMVTSHAAAGVRIFAITTFTLGNLKFEKLRNY